MVRKCVLRLIDRSYLAQQLSFLAKNIYMYSYKQFFIVFSLWMTANHMHLKVNFILSSDDLVIL